MEFVLDVACFQENSGRNTLLWLASKNMIGIRLNEDLLHNGRGFLLVRRDMTPTPTFQDTIGKVSFVSELLLV